MYQFFIDWQCKKSLHFRYIPIKSQKICCINWTTFLGKWYLWTEQVIVLPRQTRVVQADANSFHFLLQYFHFWCIKGIVQNLLHPIFKNNPNYHVRQKKNTINGKKGYNGKGQRREIEEKKGYVEGRAHWWHELQKGTKQCLVLGVTLMLHRLLEAIWRKGIGSEDDIAIGSESLTCLFLQFWISFDFHRWFVVHSGSIFICSTRTQSE